MAGLMESMISASMEANARKDIEKPIAKSMANQNNATAFREFMAACKEFGIQFTSIDEAMDSYVKFSDTTGKS